MNLNTALFKNIYNIYYLDCWDWIIKPLSFSSGSKTIAINLLKLSERQTCWRASFCLTRTRKDLIFLASFLRSAFLGKVLFKMPKKSFILNAGNVQTNENYHKPIFTSIGTLVISFVSLICYNIIRFERGELHNIYGISPFKVHLHQCLTKWLAHESGKSMHTHFPRIIPKAFDQWSQDLEVEISISDVHLLVFRVIPLKNGSGTAHMLPQIGILLPFTGYIL